jgi:iron complex outermembrane receptor protein
MLVACAQVASLAAPSPARAEGTGDPVIVVSARRVDERAEDVPLDVAIIGADGIGVGGVDGLQNLAARVPGLSFEAMWGGSNAFPVLRGQSQPSIAGDAVGMFVDGVYQANRDALDIEPLDLERIEVVNGPQSALFGHSSFAGLIQYVPAKPSEDYLAGGSADIGSDGYRGLQGVVSGPLGGSFKGRLAASWRQADGTWENAARAGQHLGDVRRFAVVASLATREGSGPFSAALSGRYGKSRMGQPPFYTLDYRQYNCGGRDPSAGVWSYFCGPAPLARRLSISPDLPDSRSRSGQVALHLALDLAGVELRSDTSYYRAKADIYRDFDGSVQGDVYGVCLLGFNCSGAASQTIPVLALQGVNIVQRHPGSAREIAEEFRVRSTGSRRFAWMVGAAAIWTRQDQRTNFAYGAARGGLPANERFSSIVLADPLRVGPPATINSALVDDPTLDQVVQNEAVEFRHTLALFASGEYRLAPGLRARGELRANWERLRVDSRIANFAPSFGTRLGARTFFDLTPRFGLDYRPAPGWLAYASYARGSRSGGINAVPNLLPQEQTFAPETNWTGEIGLKYAGAGLVRSARLTAYAIDWDNTQILGFATSPGVPVLITRNTAGIRTRGIEIGGELAPARWLAVDFGYSHADPRFKRGSEDPGSNAFCGLAPGVSTSSFCAVRPSAINPGQLVADISGKVPARAARTSWSAGATLTSPWHRLGELRLRVDLSHQGPVFDRQIDGLYYGARTLLDARLSVVLGPIALQVWGTNLTDDRYARFAVGRQPAFYLGVPRPTDLILAERRRVGMTLRYPG